jgi:hypothetical protein
MIFPTVLPGPGILEAVDEVVKVDQLSRIIGQRCREAYSVLLASLVCLNLEGWTM